MDGLTQLAGVDALTLITMIVRAANTAIQNKKTCLELAKQVEQIRELLRSLEEQPGTAIMQRPETRTPLLDLHETLRHACELVQSCQRGGYVRQFCAGGERAARLREVQGRIDSFLRLFPIISHLDSTRLLVHVINGAAIRDQGSGVGAEDDVLWSLKNQPDTNDGHRVENFSLSQLMIATAGFSFENQIEQGPLATLFKGQLHGNDVTLRKLTLSTYGQQLPLSMSAYELFKNEIKILPKLQHKNIVKLVGFCAERSERILVYEYMENGSLEDLIFVRVTASPTINWPKRFHIIEGIAQGVDYMHNHSRHRIVHRDLKPSNILLDCDLNPRIANFDLAKVLSPDKDHDTADCVVGSIAFIAPEYMKNGAFSVKTDVYSFGVMVLEIISGKRWTKSLQETYYKDLLTWAFRRTSWCGAKLELRLKDFIHPSIQGVSFCGTTVPLCLSFPARRSILSQQKEIVRCVRVALLCIQENPQRRPDMAEATRILRPHNSKVSLPGRPGYAKETSIYAGDRSPTA